MNRPFVTTAALVLTLLAGPATQAAEPAAMSETAKMIYALGYQLGRDLAGTEVQSDSLLAGITDGQKGTQPKLSPQEMEAALKALEQRISEQRGKEQAAAAQKAAAAGSAYLAENALAAGVKTTASGLQYKVLTAGSGPKPTLEQTVVCQYRGTLIDGKEFDSSYKRGQPATFPVKGVIKGWTEVLQLMPVGSKWQVFIPPDLTYGTRGAGADIGPNATLIFEVELVAIK